MTDDPNMQLVYEGQRKSIGVTYLLWLLFGLLGIHRFYAGATKSAVIQLVLSLTFFGLIISVPWWLADSLLIPGVVRDQNAKTFNILNHGSPHAPAAIQDERRIPSKVDRKREAMLEDLRSTGYRKQRRDTSHLYR